MRGELSTKDIGQAEFFFGKHKGRTYDQIAAEDFPYLVWIAEQNILGRAARLKLKAYLERADNQERIRSLPENERPKTSGQFVIPFGKHKSETLSRVAAEDPAYIEWLISTWLPGQKPGRVFRDAVQEFAEQLESERRQNEEVLAASTG